MKPRLNQGGQAVAEYLLLIVFSVAVMIAIAGKLFTPIKKWTDFYLSTYTSCLLDFGVLPGAGVKTTDCQTLANSSGFGDNAKNGAGGGKNDDGSGGDGAADAAKKSAAADENERASGAAKRRNPVARRSPRVVNNRGQSVQFAGNQGVGEAGTGESNSTVINTSEKLEGQYGRNSRYSRFEEKKIKAKFIGGVSSEEVAKLASSGEAKMSRAEADLAPAKSKRIPFIPPKRKESSIGDDQETKFDSGNLFRMGMMAIIIVGVIYVVGSQLNSLSKSMED